MMRIGKRTCFIALFIAGFSVSLVYAHTGGKAVCVKTPRPVKVDGNLAEWDLFKAEAVELDPFNAPKWYKFGPADRVSPADVTDKKDWFGTFFTMWDDQNFYFAGDVTDDKVVPVNNQAEVDINLYEADCIAFGLDLLHDAKQGVGWKDDDFLFYVLIRDTKGVAQTREWNQEPWGPKKDQPAIEVASKVDGSGYRFEATLPWAELMRVHKMNFKPKEGETIGFEPTGYENDNNDMARDAKIVWSATINQHRNPWEWGELTLGGVLAVESTGKLAITWGKIKSND
ncbi:hypothetical protein HYR99_18835 [Candidatus Poribacteria bacterium]|nr:hypothetical protein [Candidatus Poribacteria bacterium]